ncbi:hypothetical protein ACNKHU_18020 [Shigella flexneri]
MLTRGDLVLFDRNNHKSNHHGALISGGDAGLSGSFTQPVWFIGGIDAHCFNEEYLRQQIRDVAPEKPTCRARSAWRLLGLGTYKRHCL